MTHLCLCRRYDVIVYGPTTDGAPDEQRRRELAQQAIDGSGSNVRSVLTFNSTDAIKAASSPYEYCPVADNSQFFVFFRLEYKSDVSVGWNVGWNVGWGVE